MMLSDISIQDLLRQGDLVISPMPRNMAFQPASVDLALGNEFMSPYADIKSTPGSYYTILPGECVLGTTRERVVLPDDVVGRVEGKSSWGRRFLLVHTTAGFIDPGFRGQITLELTNLSRVPLSLTVGEPICQISFAFTDRAVSRPYGSAGLNSHYQDQVGVRAARHE